VTESEPHVSSQRCRDVLDYEVGARIVVKFTTRGHERIITAKTLAAGS
jgi:hypothetical protein